jgi:hypothetical protein
MRLLPPPPEPVTSKDIARALEWAWKLHHDGCPTVESAAALTWPSMFLTGVHPLEFEAVHDRSRAALARKSNPHLSLAEWLDKFGRAASTHHRNWARGCQRIATGINELEGRTRRAACG